MKFLQKKATARTAALTFLCIRKLLWLQMHIIISDFQKQSKRLSGAVESLKMSITINKKNIDARNLLGLVYCEMGDVVEALSEWVISKNIQPDNNCAEDYITDIQSNQNKLSLLLQQLRSIICLSDMPKKAIPIWHRFSSKRWFHRIQDF